MSILSSASETITEMLTQLESDLNQTTVDRQAIEVQIADIEAELVSMKQELHSVTKNSEKDSYLSQIEKFKARIGSAKKALLFKRSSSTSSSSSSMSNKAVGQVLKHDDAEISKQQANLKRLQQSAAQLQECQDIGTATHDALKNQNVQIQEQRSMMQEIKAGLDHSTKLVKNMLRRG